MLSAAVFALAIVGCASRPPQPSRLPAAATTPSTATTRPAYITPRVTRLGTGEARLPFEYNNGRPLVAVGFPGDDRVWHFLIDTGANLLIVSPQVAADQRLERWTTAWAVDLTKKRATVPVVRIKSIALAGASFEDVDAAVIDMGWTGRATGYAARRWDNGLGALS